MADGCIELLAHCAKRHTQSESISVWREGKGRIINCEKKYDHRETG